MKIFPLFRKEREAAAKDGSSIKNKMFLEQAEEFLVHEVNHSVRQLCKTIDAFIFVVDSSTSKEKGKCFMRSKRTISIEPFPDILMSHVTSQFFILLTSPHGQGHHNSVSQLLWAVLPIPPCQLSLWEETGVPGENPPPTHTLFTRGLGSSLPYWGSNSEP